jgi:hypothetical protein
MVRPSRSAQTPISLSGTPNKQLNIGKSIFYNERINTTNSGLVQVLLVDGSTFTVGPNSNLVIDRFVYDPRKKTGELVATFSKGTMRFIGGKLSKNEGGVTVNTPSGALAIRGGMFQGSTSRATYSFLFGHSLTYTGRSGQTQTVYQTGYTLDLSGGTPTVRPTTTDDINAIMTALTNGNTDGVGSTSNNEPSVQQTLQETVSLQDLISEATATQIDSTLQQEENETPPDNTNNNPPPDNTNNNPPPDDDNNPPGQFRSRRGSSWRPESSPHFQALTMNTRPMTPTGSLAAIPMRRLTTSFTHSVSSKGALSAP